MKWGDKKKYQTGSIFATYINSQLFSELYADVDSQDNSSCASNEDGKIPKEGEVHLKNRVRQRRQR